MANVPRRDAQAGGHSPNGAVGTRHVRVGAKVNVQQRRVGTLHQYGRRRRRCRRAVASRGHDRPLPARDSVGHQRHRVGNIGLQHLRILIVPRHLRLHVIVKRMESLVLGRKGASKGSRERAELAQVPNPQARAVGFGRVGRANALLRGPNLGSPPLHFPEAVHYLVVIKEQVSPVRQTHPRGRVRDALRLEGGQLLHQRRHVDDDAIANNSGGVRVEQSRRQQVESILHVVHDNGVARIGSARTAGDHVIAGSKQVNELSLALIAPLSTQDHQHLSRGGWCARRDGDRPRRGSHGGGGGQWRG